MSYSIPDVLWEEIKMVIPVKKSFVGRPELDAKKCLDAIFGILKTGAQWASIPRSIAHILQSMGNLESGSKWEFLRIL